MVQTSGGVELAKSVLVPLLTAEAIDFLHSAGTAEERHLWVALGEGWTKCRYVRGGVATGGSTQVAGRPLGAANSRLCFVDVFIGSVW